jgi:hypothetical protein
LRRRYGSSDAWGNVEHIASSHNSSTLVAFYCDLDRTIYLPGTWTGTTPVELSVLVQRVFTGNPATRRYSADATDQAPRGEEGDCGQASRRCLRQLIDSCATGATVR